MSHIGQFSKRRGLLYTGQRASARMTSGDGLRSIPADRS
jgi:hypothetical protein